MKRLTTNLLLICVILVFTAGCQTFKQVEASIFEQAEIATATTNTLTEAITP